MVDLDAGQANYLANVMRKGAGDHVLLFDGATGEWLARIEEVGRKVNKTHATLYQWRSRLLKRVRELSAEILAAPTSEKPAR